MRLFGKRESMHASGGVQLPPDLIARLERYGRYEFDPQGSGVEAIGQPAAEYPLLQLAKGDPDGFLAALASEAIPVGGWTVYGAMRLAWNFGLMKAEPHYADADAIGLAALHFVRDAGYGWEHLSLDEKALWRRAVAEEW
jgi:hypothetical protein